MSIFSPKLWRTFARDDLYYIKVSADVMNFLAPMLTRLKLSRAKETINNISVPCFRGVWLESQKAPPEANEVFFWWW